MGVHDLLQSWRARLIPLQPNPDISLELRAYIEQYVQAIEAASKALSDTLSVWKQAREDILDYQRAFQKLMCIEAQRNALGSLLNNVVSLAAPPWTMTEKFSEDDALDTIWGIQTEIADELDKMSEFNTTWVQRTAFNDAIRPFARPLAIHDIPIELWIMIFEKLVGEDDDGQLWVSSDYVAGGRNPIKDIRLTCHRFCDASSHFLFRRVDVAFDPTSLERLDNISRHKIFSASVRALRVDLSYYEYHDRLAREELAFVRATMHKVCKWMHIDTETLEFSNDPRTSYRWQLGLSKSQMADVAGKVGRVVAVWRAYLDSGGTAPSFANGEASDETRAAIHAVRECHREYRRRFGEQVQRHGQHGSDLARSAAVAVAVAMSRMPKAVQLFMTDNMSHLNSFEFQRSTIGTPIEICAQDLTMLIRKSMLQPTMTWQRSGGNPWVFRPPGHLLHLIPLALHQAGVPLLHLDIEVSWNGCATWDLDDNTVSHLRALAKTLKSFKYHGPPDFPRISASSIERYLSALVSGDGLEEIHIAFLLEHAESMSVDSVLASLSSGTKIRSITLRDCSFHLHELQSVLQKCEANDMTLIALHGVGLQSGTWADALDDLREVVADRTTVAYVNRPAGAECDNMSRELYNSVFLTGTNQRYQCSKANKYISSSIHNHIPNPLRPGPAEHGLSPAGQSPSDDT